MEWIDIYLFIYLYIVAVGELKGCFIVLFLVITSFLIGFVSFGFYIRLIRYHCFLIPHSNKHNFFLQTG